MRKAAPSLTGAGRATGSALAGLAERALRQRIGTLRLAEHAEPERQRRADLPGQSEQRARLAGLELQLQLAERRFGLAGGDLALVEHHLDHAVLAGDQPDRPAEFGADLQLQRPGFLRLEQFPERRFRQRRIVEREAGYLRLPFAAEEQAGGGGGLVLHRLDMAPARLAHAQRIAGMADDPVLRVEIGGVGLGDVPASPRPAPGMPSAPRHPRQRRRISARLRSTWLPRRALSPGCGGSHVIVTIWISFCVSRAGARIDLSMSGILVTPVSAIATRISASMISSNFVTPAPPCAARA